MPNLIAPCHKPLPFAPATRRAPAQVMVIAEIGVNHDGHVAKAIELVDLAADAGADAVKVQLFNTDDLLSNQAKLADYQIDQHETDIAQMLRRLQLTGDQLLQVRLAARRHEMDFIVTPFSLSSTVDLELLDPDAIKIASPDAVNTPLLDHVAKLNKPLIISTGTCKLSELGYAAGLVRDQKAGGCLLQCVSSYPVPDEQAALGGMSALARRFGVPVGYSDHTTDVMTGALAVAAGACVIEKHITYDRAATGPDHAASFDGKAFDRYVKLIRRATHMLGQQDKVVSEIESQVAIVSRQSVCAAYHLKAGHVLKASDLTIKRPGTGIPAAHLPHVLGRKLLRDVKRNDLLTEEDLIG